MSAKRWSTPTDVVAAVRRRWNDGTLLCAYAADAPFPEIDLPLSGPTARTLGDDVERAREWAAALERAARGGRAFELVTGTVGGREIARTRLPVRARVVSYAQAFALLGTAADSERYRSLVEEAGAGSRAQQWALEHPLRALAVADDWAAILVAVARLDSARGSGAFLRQLGGPGVHTKLIESRRAVIGAILGVTTSANGFLDDLGLAPKPTFVRLRICDGAFGFPAGLTDLSLRTGELDRLDLAPERALIIENEVTFLSMPVPPGGVVLWGKGYDVHEPASLGWLRRTPVSYWGDLDTHGFAILNRVRTHLPQTTSLLMDRGTLLTHEDRWGREPAPITAALPTLTDAESALYEDLVTDRFGAAVRLEQELIDWKWVDAALVVEQ
ncbi:Wadjet anti-phage system protein JetD domain-containing protein [Agromyces archimandritae]|uniref:DUF3322 and DUF2220 domain-containing protein n=1 Tax=Agromyces archimandritae TaxID=2781962 RepID=A0A975IQE7_9MICO|nr:DUF3322 and DUF2220 domain-containing protein [Agromyces archimandritae]QTX04956.1 hypothetical protein G127AT_01500 [Agromyces archimandritae]